MRRGRRGLALSLAPWLTLVFLLAPLALGRGAVAASGEQHSRKATAGLFAPIEIPPIEFRGLSGDRRLPVDYASAIRLAAAKNLDILRARARLRERRGERLREAGGVLPSLSSALRASRIDGEIQASFGELDRRAFSTIEPGATVHLRFNPGESVFDLLAAHKRVEAGQFQEDQVTQETLALVATLYFGLLRAQVGVDIARAEVQTAGELVRLARDRQQLGVGLKVEAARAQAHLAQAQVARAAAEERFRSASVDLAEALRLEPQLVLLPTEHEVRPVALVAAEENVEVLFAAALERRPGLRERKLELDAARDKRSAAWWAGLGPEVLGTFEESAIGRSFDVNDRQIYGGFIGWTLSPSSIGELRAASARVERAQLERERFEQRVLGDIVKARDRVLTARERICAARRGVEAAEQSLRLSRDRFEGGVGLDLEVLEGQETLTDARSALVGAVVDYNIAQVRLLLALGGATEEKLVHAFDGVTDVR